MVLILMGVSGSGKTTIGELLEQRLGWPYYDGDDFHPPANVEKMGRGVPLTQEDRIPWLQALRALMRDLEAKGRSGIIGCSALTTSFRSHLVEGFEDVRFVHLKGDFDLIHQRMQERAGHYMKAEMLRSQFRTLEAPEGEVLTINVDRSPEEIATFIERQLDLQKSG